MTARAEKGLVRIDLTPQQIEQLRITIGRDVEAIELTVEELEQRIAPRLASNHNETLLVHP
ncbi:MAG TPA: hypothetical protein VKP00_02990 [Gemmatimonadaceae bacterium]|nr:hypothetical protein [Gemmatimonadaceae bacterium]